MYWMGMKDLSTWDNEAKYLVMDDIDWKFVPDMKGFWGAQKTITLTDKYTRKKTVTWNKPLIFLCNYNPREQEGWTEWHADRSIIVNCMIPLY